MSPHIRSLDRFRAELRDALPEIAARYGVTQLGLFGSYVRGEQRADSDLDVLVEFAETPGLLRYIELEDYLTDRLGVRVDLALQESLKPKIGERVRCEVVPV